MSVFTSPSSSNQVCSLSKTVNKTTKASEQKPTRASLPGFLEALFSCFSARSKSQKTTTQRPTSPLLGAQEERFKGRKTLVLDLDETLVHTSNTATGQCLRNMCIRINNGRIFVAFRPGVKEFLKKMGAIYEIVIFTASLKDYAEQVVKALDDDGVVAHQLYRESCTQHGSSLVKDLSRLNRPLKDIIILDNSTICYDFHPNNGLKIEDFIDNPKDVELAKMIPLLELLSVVDDVRPIQSWQEVQHRVKENSHKNLRINTIASMRTMTSTEEHITSATVSKQTGISPLISSTGKQGPRHLIVPEKEGITVH